MTQSIFKHLVTRYLIVVVWLAIPFQALQAASAENKQYDIPAFLLQTKMATDASIIAMAEDNQFNSKIRQLATQLLHEKDASSSDASLFRLNTLSGNFVSARENLQQHNLLDPKTNRFHYLHYQLYLGTRIAQSNKPTDFSAAFTQQFNSIYSNLNNLDASRAGKITGYSLSQGRSYLLWLFSEIKNRKTEKFLRRLLNAYADYWVYHQVFDLAAELIAKDNGHRYFIDDKVLINTSDGASISAIVVRPKNASKPLPAAMMFNIYTVYQRNLNEAINAAARGYIGVVADTRGKRLSPNDIRPYETEVTDVNSVIDWVSRQHWSDGRVGSYGGSYLGFAQWASAKKLHPALKTMVPYAAVIPGQGLPMENNVFLNANYGWAFYVTNNKTVDHSIYDQHDRWQNLNENWYQQGRAYREFDKIDGTPNPWLQRWLKHPEFDEYWQSMVPYKKDFSKIDIPVLSITGYYDDSQISAIHYLSEHYKYHSNPEHYLLIGPYDHNTSQATQRPQLRNYTLDPVAHVNVPELTFEWFDYIFKNQPKPELIKDKINYQLMGDNSWQHAPFLEALHAGSKKLYLSTETNGQYNLLSSTPQKEIDFLSQKVDLKDRTTQHNDYYPWPIIKDELEVPNGLAFVSEPFEQDTELSGRITGELRLSINKKDLDIGLVFYELTSEGKAFHLSYYLGRASYAKDMSKRQLLTPGKIETIPFERTRMTSKMIKKGSRIAVLANVNKNKLAQINYGTGKDVSDETIDDAEEPLIIRWYSDSYINLPLQKQH